MIGIRRVQEIARQYKEKVKQLKSLQIAGWDKRIQNNKKIYLYIVEREKQKTSLTFSIK